MLCSFFILSNFLDCRSLYPSAHWAQIRAENIVSHGITQGISVPLDVQMLSNFISILSKQNFVWTLNTYKPALKLGLILNFPTWLKKTIKHIIQEIDVLFKSSFPPPVWQSHYFLCFFFSGAHHMSCFVAAPCEWRVKVKRLPLQFQLLVTTSGGPTTTTTTTTSSLVQDNDDHIHSNH